MSYLVLARKYRPRTFGDVVGQEVAMRTLRGAIQEDRVGHAYVFAGPRGTGKTTSARIFAKALNCERGPTAEPCGVCERCVEADRGADADIIEIDAASNTGVDYARDLKQTASTGTYRARFKIFIIDEAHMLSKQAFNALLKTLEEPPPHAKFFLATTEPSKLLDTIRSRCQMIQLAPLSEREIADRLSFVFEQEGIRAEPGVAGVIAQRARGGMRDALSMADQLLSLVGSEPTLADAERLSGDGGAELIDELFDRVEAKDAAGVLERLVALDGGHDELLDRLLDHVRACLIAAICGAKTPILAADDALRAKLAQRGERLGAARLQLWLEELLAARERMRLLPGQAHITLEVALLDLCRPETDVPLSEIERRLTSLASGLASGTPRDLVRPEPRRASSAPSSATPGAAPVTAPARAPAVDASAPRKTASGAPAREPGGSTEVWERFLGALSSASLAEVLRARGRLVAVGAGGARVRLTGVRPDDAVLLRDPRNAKACSAAMTKVLGQPCDVVLEDDAPPAPQKPQDLFTGQVSDMFAGRIEDEG